MLILSVVILGAAVSLGLWLAGLYMLLDRPPGRLTAIGVIHGCIGTAGLTALVLALSGPITGAKYGAPAFGNAAAALLVAALLGGLTVATTHLRKRNISIGLVAMHGMFGVVGYVILCTYLTMTR